MNSCLLYLVVKGFKREVDSSTLYEICWNLSLLETLGGDGLFSSDTHFVLDYAGFLSSYKVTSRNNMVCESTQTRNGITTKGGRSKSSLVERILPVVLSNTSGSRRRQEHFTKLERSVSTSSTHCRTIPIGTRMTATATGCYNSF